jgi:hypothetical protein
MGKWFVPNTVGRSHGLEGTKRPTIQLLLLFKGFHTLCYIVQFNCVRKTARKAELHVLRQSTGLSFF